jgi:V8-like Glu-specific endopeptidase
MRPIQFFLLKANAYQKDSHGIKQQLTTEPGKSGSPILVKREIKLLQLEYTKEVFLILIITSDEP